MSAVAFDTLKLARSLRDTAKMSQEQAEGVADALAEAMSGAELATKSDVTATEVSLRRDLAMVEATLKRDIADIQRDMATKTDLAEIRTAIADARVDTLRWVFAAVVGQTALIVGLVKFWH